MKRRLELLQNARLPDSRIGRREALVRAGVTTRRTTDAVVRVQDLNVDARLGRVDLLAGFSRVVWGRLDELQPTDVVNPLDVSRFFFEGRSEARLPVALARARVFLADNASVEAVYVPAFRRGRFDQLDEPSSPFNIAGVIGSQLAVCLAIGCPTLPPVVEEHRPAFTMRNAQGGARFSATSGRVDWSVSAYRGFEPFGLYRDPLHFDEARVALVGDGVPALCVGGGRGHGATVAGATVEKACVTAIFLEDSAELQYMALNIGPPQILPDKYLKRKLASGLQERPIQTTNWWYRTPA